MRRPFFHARTVLLTGATRGIGADMLSLLIADGATVLAVGRDQAALDMLEAAHPGKVHGLAADLADPAMWGAIVNWVADQHPQCDTLINNAAIMLYPEFFGADAPHLPDIATEIAINLTAPISLSVAMLPVLTRAARPVICPVICNVTSGLAIAPKTDAPVYCATKAGLRSFTKTLRYQAQDADSALQVSEALLPVVDTSLSRGDPARKMAPRDVARAILDGIARGEDEIWIGKARALRVVHAASPRLADRIMRRMG